MNGAAATREPLSSRVRTGAHPGVLRTIRDPRVTLATRQRAGLHPAPRRAVRHVRCNLPANISVAITPAAAPIAPAAAGPHGPAWHIIAAHAAALGRHVAAIVEIERLDVRIAAGDAAPMHRSPLIAGMSVQRLRSSSRRRTWA